MECISEHCVGWNETRLHVYTACMKMEVRLVAFDAWSVTYANGLNVSRPEEGKIKSL